MPKLPIYGTDFFDVIAIGFGGYNPVTNSSDRIRALAGNDIVASAEGDDLVWGDGGDDILLGQGGADRLRGGNGNDQLFGGLGNDRLMAGNGDDTLYGGEGDDRLWGNKGNNVLFGEAGNDLLNSGDHTSVLDGGIGDDTLELRGKKGGDHVATGGAGADTFEFGLMSVDSQSDMTITDFELGVDDFSIEGVNSAAYFAGLDGSVITEDNGDAILTLGTGDTIRFSGVSEAALQNFFGLSELNLAYFPPGFIPNDNETPAAPWYELFDI
ncbi:MAG: calcium-binding protein [Pseudomonadota bacterium]